MTSAQGRGDSKEQTLPAEPPHCSTHIPRGTHPCMPHSPCPCPCGPLSPFPVPHYSPKVHGPCATELRAQNLIYRLRFPGQGSCFHISICCAQYNQSMVERHAPRYLLPLNWWNCREPQRAQSGLLWNYRVKPASFCALAEPGGRVWHLTIHVPAAQPGGLTAAGVTPTPMSFGPADAHGQVHGHILDLPGPTATFWCGGWPDSDLCLLLRSKNIPLISSQLTFVNNSVNETSNGFMKAAKNVISRSWSRSVKSPV